MINFFTQTKERLQVFIKDTNKITGKWKYEK